jgi:hypothetical protein
MKLFPSPVPSPSLPALRLLGHPSWAGVLTSAIHPDPLAEVAPHKGHSAASGPPKLQNRRRSVATLVLFRVGKSGNG